MNQPLLFLLCLLAILSGCTSDSNHKDYSKDKAEITANNLINPKSAYSSIKKNPDQFIIVQVSKEEPYLSEHIPAAQNIWRPDYGSEINKPYGGLIPTKEKLQSLLQDLGFEKGKTLLLYDLKANVDALRFAWVLKLYGFDDYKLINGGLKYWKISDLPITDDLPAQPDKTNFQLGDSFNKNIIADLDDVKAAIEDTNTLLIDTREDYEYLGNPFINKDTVLLYKKGAFARGSIPTAIHLNWSTLADLDGDHRIKSEHDLRHDLKKYGISKDKNIILYCQSGSRTSHTHYVLTEILDFENVKNYDGSWIEWSYHSTIDELLPMQQITSEEQSLKLKDSLLLTLKH